MRGKRLGGQVQAQGQRVGSRLQWGVRDAGQAAREQVWGLGGQAAGEMRQWRQGIGGRHRHVGQSVGGGGKQQCIGTGTEGHWLGGT